MPSVELVARIDALLPQTQCEQCGFPGCHPYAAAVASNQSGINRCPPGGERTIAELAELLDRPVVDLDPELGTAAGFDIAWIDERWCIGCALCIAACPVDAIIGASKRMHTVLESACTGCGLCIAPCPVDCIEMREPAAGYPDWSTWMRDHAPAARHRFEARGQRLERIAVRRREKQKARRHAQRRRAPAEQKRAEIQAAVARVRNKRRTK